MRGIKEQIQEYNKIASANPEQALKYVFELTVEEVNRMYYTMRVQKSIRFKLGLICGIVLSGLVYWLATNHGV